MSYDAMVITAHPDDAEVQMGGMIARLTSEGRRVLIVDLCAGEPSDFAEAGVRAEQAQRAARILGAERVLLDAQDRFIQDTIPLRLALAQLIRQHRPRWLFGTTAASIHPDHAAVEPLVRAAAFYARLDRWDAVPGGESLADTEPWAIERLFYPHCKLEPAWGQEFAFAVDVSTTYERKRQAIAEYRSLFQIDEGDRLLTLYEAEDQYIGRLFGVAYAETFRSHSPLLVDDLAVFKPGLHG